MDGALTASFTCNDVEVKVPCWDADEVVEGLDLGVSRMKVDEKAELTVSPAYAYKDQVSDCGLRSNAAFVVNVL